MSNPPRGRRVRVLLRFMLPVFVVLGLLLSYRLVWRGGSPSLVVYCAHDSVYAEEILGDFTGRTRIPYAVQFDTEATKSLGLVERLIHEKDAPRCDVFWNNELLGTMDLQEKGLLLPYQGEGYQRIPSGCKDPEGHWVGFGARLRVYIVNTEKLSPTEEAVREALERDLSRVAIAKPLYGTTLTHYSVLWHLWGGEKLKSWHRQWRERGVTEVTGNRHSKDLVASGVCQLGFTDTDDFFVAKDEGKPVAMLPVRLENGATICIPNTVCIIKGTRRFEQAKRLVDYLLSEECELALANSKSRQIPVGRVDEMQLSGEVKELKQWVDDAYPLIDLSTARADCLSWLKSEYVR